MSTNCQKLYSERRSNPVTDGKEVCCAKKPFKSHLTCGKFGKGYVNWPSTVYDPPPHPPSPYPLHPIPYPLHPTPFTLPPSPYPPAHFTLSPFPLLPSPYPPSPNPLHTTLFTLPPSPYPLHPTPSPYPLHPIPLHPTPFTLSFFTLSPFTLPLHPIPLHPIPLHPELSSLPQPPTLTSKHSEVPPLIIKKIHNNFAPCKFVIARTFFYGLPRSWDSIYPMVQVIWCCIFNWCLKLAGV